ncbi:MAG: UvrD-helicase domain-containing protein [Pseudomonadota bacterium]|nr:UvrD-helicase domain-containing protein [Pseudomonadota bacterium]
MTLPDQTARDQALKVTSCLVRAPAGSGKTTLLANRYIHLLLTANRPQEILAITFTKKAAAEMRQRVLALLHDDSATSQAVRKRAASLDWALFTNPNVLKIQTIDSFALELATQAQGIDGLAGMSIVEDASFMYEAAVDGLFQQLIDELEAAPLIAEFLAFLDNDAQSARRLIVTMLTKRDQWLDLTNEIAMSAEKAQQALCLVLNRTLDKLRNNLSGELSGRLTGDDNAQIEGLCGPADPDGHFSGLDVLLTQKNELRKRFTRNDGVGDQDQVRQLNQWLLSLHDRGIAELLEKYALVPPPVTVVDLHIPTLASTVLSLAAVELKKIFQDRHEVDFSELLRAAMNAIRDREGRPTDLALLLDYRIKHILVDEYQDTSRAQFEFFSLLCESWSASDSNTFFGVGDPMQSIYRFRNADVSIFMETATTGMGQLPITLCDLQANFRSTKTIIEWCNRTFADLFQGASKYDIQYTPAIAQGRTEGQPVACRSFGSLSDEHAFVIHRIRELLAEDKDAEITLLCRARSHIEKLISELRKQGIAWRATDMDLLTTAPIVQDLFSCLKLIVNPSEPMNWLSVLRSPLAGFSLNELTALATAPGFEAALDRSNNLASERIAIAFNWARAMMFERSAREVVEGFWFRAGGGAAYDSSVWVQAEAFLDLLEPFGTQLIDLQSIENQLARLYSPARSHAPVTIMTIHKAKGLEFDHVIVPGLNHQPRADDAALISIGQTQGDLLLGVRGDPLHGWLAIENRQQAAAEDKRMLYVACTRAKSTLALTYTHESGKRPRGLARLISAYASTTSTKATEPEFALSQPTSVQTELRGMQPYKRISPAFRWTPPESFIADKALPPDLIASRNEVATGTLVHQTLAWIARNAPYALSWKPQEMSVRMQQWSEDLPISADAAHQVVETALAQVNRLIGSSLGKWVLAPHASHVAELHLSALLKGEVTHVVIDRMFVENGERWIIDYKSSQLETHQDQAQMISRYRPQLEQYSAVCQLLFAEPIRCALLLTDIPELVEL